MRFKAVLPPGPHTGRAPAPRSLATEQMHRRSGPDDDFCDAQLNAHLTSLHRPTSYERGDDGGGAHGAAIRDEPMLKFEGRQDAELVLFDLP